MNSQDPSPVSPLQYVCRHLKPFRSLLCFSLCASACYSLVDASIVYFIKTLIDQGLVDKNPIFLQYFPWIFPLLFAFRGTMGFLSAFFMGSVASRFLERMRQDMLRKILKLPARQFDTVSSSHWVSKLLYNAEQVAHLCTELLTDAIRESCLVIGLLAVMLYIQPALTFVFLLVLPLLLAAFAWVSRRLRQTGYGIQAALQEVTRITQEMLDNYREIRLFGSESFESSRFLKNIAAYRQYAMRQVRIRAASIPVIQWLCALAFGWTMFWAIQDFALSAGDFAALITGLIALFKPIKQLSGINGNFQQAWAATSGIVELLDLPEETWQGHHVIEQVRGHIVFRDVHFSYGEKPFLQAIHGEILPGSWLAIVGHSGSGKSTLFRLLTGFYPDFSGDILLDGQDIRNYDLASLRRQFACVSQPIFLSDSSVLQNVAYSEASSPDREKAMRALKMAHLHDWLEELPHGLDTSIGENGCTLSGGQRQRLALARAIYKGSPILLLDEPTSALDHSAEKEVQRALRQIAQTRTVCVIAHRLSTVVHADCIWVMEKGKLVGAGRHEELLASNQAYQALHRDGAIACETPL